MTSQVIVATIEDGVIKSDQAIEAPTGTRVRVTIDPYDEQNELAGEPCDELDKLCDEFPIASQEDLLTRDQLHERR